MFSPHYLDDYQIMFTGPSKNTKRGSSVELICIVMTKEHHPSWIKVRTSKKAYVCCGLKPENISLPSGEWHMGKVIPIRNVSSDDAGNYTCEAVWVNPNYTKTAVYTMKVTCKYSNNAWKMFQYCQEEVNCFS